MEKRRRGRPPTGVSDGREKFTTRLRPETIAFLREVGRGNANAGIERLEQAFKETLRTTEERIKVRIARSDST